MTSHPSIQVDKYITPEGRCPFDDRLDGFRDRETEGRIRKRIIKLQRGVWGDCKPVGDGVIELREHFGPGYRIYVAKLNRDTHVLLLVAGSKGTQDADIALAKQYWKAAQNEAGWLVFS